MKSLRALAIFLLAAVLLWSLFEGIARRQLRLAAATGWPLPSGSLAEVADAFPAREDNDAARQLNRILLPLGIELAEQGNGPSRSTAPADKEPFKGELKEYLSDTLGTQLEAAPPPQSVTDFLRSNEPTLAAVVAHLRSSEPLQWRSDVGKGLQAPIPPVLAHLTLCRLLVARSLGQRSEANPTPAWETLEAASNLTEPLWDRPDLISQMIAAAEAKYILGAMRVMPPDAPAWARGWPARDLRASMLRSQAAESFSVWQLMKSSPGTDLSLAADPSTGSSWFHRGIFVVLSPYFRFSGAQLLEANRKVLAELASATQCSGDVRVTTTAADLSSWNTFGKGVFMELDQSWERLHKMLAHSDGTQILLLARTERAASGSFPATVTLPRQHCAPDLWKLESTGSTASLKFTGQLAADPTPASLELPTEYPDLSR